MNEHFKSVVDWIAVGVASISLLGWINVVLAIPAAIWTCIRIYEWFKGRK